MKNNEIYDKFRNKVFILESRYLILVFCKKLGLARPLENTVTLHHSALMQCTGKTLVA